MKKISKCKNCHEEIRWARTCYGKSLPLVPTPMPNGELTFRNDGKVVLWMQGAPLMGRLPRYSRHQCPPEVRAIRSA